jgi:hypothetical protein
MNGAARLVPSRLDRPSRRRQPGNGLPSSHQLRTTLRSRLEARRSEIERALLTRVYGVADPTEVDDPTYTVGFRAAAEAAFDFALATLEQPHLASPVPPVLLSQARLAARNDVSLDTVLRRYAAGHALLVDFLFEEAQGVELLPATALRRIFAATSSTFDRLLAAVGEEYSRELVDRADFSPQHRKSQLVRRLLAGEPLDPAGLAYDLDVWHVGLVLKGVDGRQQLRELATTIDCRLLLVEPQEQLVWAWLGTRHSLDPAELLRLCRGVLAPGMCMVLGEPGAGTAGWRLSHEQAMAALPVALRGEAPCVRYGDVALLASILQDELLITSLRQLYLVPLEDQRDGGANALHTLRVYFELERNASSAAVALGVSRQTVAYRLRAIEHRLGRRLSNCFAELDAAMQLHNLDVARAE